MSLILQMFCVKKEKEGLPSAFSGIRSGKREMKIAFCTLSRVPSQ